MEKMPGLLIRCGLIILIFGFFKNTTVDTPLGQIHNIGLMQQSQNLMLIGGFMFLGGLLLKGSSKDSSAEKPDGIKKAGSNEVEFMEFVGSITANSRLMGKKCDGLVERLNNFRDRFFLRLGVGLGAGLLALNIGSFFFPLTIISCILFGALSMRAVPSAIALRKILLVSSSLSGLIFTTFLISKINDPEPSIDIIVFSFVLFLILAIGYFRFRRLAKS